MTLTQIPDYPGYYCNKEEDIFSYRRTNPVKMKQFLDHKGYYYIQLWNENGAKKKKVHRILYCTFVENIPSSVMLDHIDGDRTNNSLDNLRKSNHRLNGQVQNKRKNNKTGEHNIYKNNESSSYSVAFRIYKQQRRFGSYKTLEELPKYNLVKNPSTELEL